MASGESVCRRSGRETLRGHHPLTFLGKVWKYRYYSSLTGKIQVVVNYNDLKTIQTYRTVAPTAPIEEESKGGSLLQRSLAGMEVAIVYHKILKGTTGRIISSSIIESKRGKRRLVYNVGKLRDNSSYTYQVKERHLRELSCVWLDVE